MKSNLHLDDDTLSVMEELDPEAKAAGKQSVWRSPGGREMVLGMVLLFGVLGWAGFTWWRDVSNRNNYAQAQHEVSLRHWDEALAHYSSAKGYRDAEARAAEAAGQIQARDSQYNALTAYRQRPGAAMRVLLAAHAVQTIQPGYKDVDRVAGEAEDHVYTDALSGTVVMRTRAQPPGLYYRGSGGWKYLLGSDAASNVLSLQFNVQSTKRVVYDVPGAGRASPFPAATPPFDPYAYLRPEGAPSLAGRSLVLAELPTTGGEPRLRSLQLKAVDYNFYICGSDGVWGIRYNPTTYGRVVVKGILNDLSVLYEKTTGQNIGEVTPVTIPSKDGVVADIGHISDELLLAARGAGVNGQNAGMLYIAGADGSNPLAVFSTTGTLISALLSQDDKRVLVVASDAASNLPGRVEVAATLLTLDGGAPPVTLQKVSVEGGAIPGGVSAMLAGALTISGVFLEAGAFKNKLLLGWVDNPVAGSARVRLLDVARPNLALVETDVPYAHTGAITAVEQADGETLLLYNLGVGAEPASTPGSGFKAALKALHLQRGEDHATVKSYGVPLPDTGAGGTSGLYLMSPTLRTGNLVYRVDSYLNGSELFNAYSLPITGADNQGSLDVQPRLIFSSEWAGSQGRGSAGPPVGVAGPDAYGYVDSRGTLHAHLYGADLDVPLEPGVGTIFALDTNYFYKVLH